MATGRADPTADHRDGSRAGQRRRVAAFGAFGVLVSGGVMWSLRESPGIERRPAPAPSTPRPPAPKPLDVPEGAAVRVPGGAFKMGSDDGEADEKPVTEVTVAPFDLDITEVTVGAYAKCVNADKCTAPDTGMYCNWKKPGRDAHPINCIDWEQATAYCAFAGKRLPAEDEWELAARGADGLEHPWKDGPPAAQLCWNGEGNDQGRGYRSGTCPVASYPSGASPFGVLDMLGNVREWTASAYCPYTSRGCSNDARVIRGAAWNNGDPAYVRAQDRGKKPPKSRPDNVGARCAKNPS